MNGIVAWVQDKKNRVVILAGLSVIAAIVIVVVLVKNNNKASQQASTSTASSTGTTATGTTPTGVPGPGGPMMTGPGGMGGMLPPPPGVSMMMPGAGGAQSTASTAPTGPIEKLNPILPYRTDPFVQPPPPNGQNQRLVAQVESLTHEDHRLAPMPVAGPGTGGDAAVDVPQPNRRLAGVMWNGKVSAILETGNETDIVYPGMTLSRGNSHVRVDSIQPSYVMLRTLDTKPARMIRVNLGAGGNAGSGAGSTMPSGMPGMPTMMPGGMPGMPGMPGGMPGMPGMPGGMPMMPGGGAID